MEPIKCSHCGLEFRPAKRSTQFCSNRCSAFYKGVNNPWPDRFWNKAKREGECLIWQGCKRNGYGIYVFATPVREEWGAHRLAYTLAKGEIPPGINVLHKCDTPLCIEPTHLFLGTHRDNVIDKVSKQRQTKGEDVNTSLLKEADVREIRKLLAADISIHRIARLFVVTNATILNIQNGKTWKHVT